MKFKAPLKLSLVATEVAAFREELLYYVPD